MEQWGQNSKRMLTKSELLHLPSFLPPTDRKAEIILWRQNARKASQAWPSSRMEEKTVARNADEEMNSKSTWWTERLASPCVWPNPKMPSYTPKSGGQGVPLWKKMNNFRKLNLQIVRLEGIPVKRPVPSLSPIVVAVQRFWSQRFLKLIKTIGDSKELLFMQAIVIKMLPFYKF